MEEQQLSLFDTDATLAPRPYEVSLLEVARQISHQFWASQILKSRQLRAWMTKAFNGSDAEGKWNWKDVSEAQEAAFVMLVREQGKSLLQGSAIDILQRLALIESLGLTHTKRSDESVELQQFSTPPQLAFLAVECARLRASDVVLEPSAGTGILAILAQKSGATVVLNELSERRTAILRKLFPGQTAYSFNGEQIHDFLPTGIRPTAIVMNPPFSASPNVRRRSSVAMTKHVRSAFVRLAPGGRLVLISARGFAPGRNEWEEAFRGLVNYRVCLSALVDGAAYAKHGTSMETRLTVLDKVSPTQDRKPIVLWLRFGHSDDWNLRSFRPSEVEKLLASLPPREMLGGGGDSETGGVGDGETGREDLETTPNSELFDHSEFRIPNSEFIKGTGREDSIEVTPEPEPKVESQVVSKIPNSKFRIPNSKGKSAPKPELKLELEPQVVSEIPNSAFRIQNSIPVSYDLVERKTQPLGDTLYEVYQPQRIRIAGAMPHPTTLCESAALASVKPSVPTYQPRLPRHVVENGLLSEAQLESVIYAGEAHSHQLRGFYRVNESFDEVEVTSSDSPVAVRFRRGWFLGDGTGAGKGRQLAGIILDNWCQGRQKALWISKSDKLLEDARRDWSALGGDQTDIVPLSRYKLGTEILLDKGIIFTTYATLRGQRPGKKSRLQQLIDWLGKNVRGTDLEGTDVEEKSPFDGVIAFDESHAMGNAIAEAGIRGTKGASQQGLAGLRLQNALPQARVLYVSATGATKVSNLAYATRLGLWQTGDFPFSNRGEFIHAIEAGGVAAMEVVARDLKALGLYFARNLSFDGVEYQALEVPLTPEQIAIYDAYAIAFQVIHTHMESALEACNIVSLDGKTQNRHAKMTAKSMFESHKQRFFNHLITAMKCPVLIRSMEEDLKNGYAVIIQLVSTSESLMKRRLAQIPVEEWNDLNIDITPREYVLDYLVSAFPIHLYETYSTDSGELLARQVRDADGNPVVSQEAMTLRDELVERLASLPPLPGALDQLLHHFGHEAVAEVTGRSQRILCEKENRPLDGTASANLDEVQAFAETGELSGGKQLASANLDEAQALVETGELCGSQQSESADLDEARVFAFVETGELSEGKQSVSANFDEAQTFTDTGRLSGNEQPASTNFDETQTLADTGRLYVSKRPASANLEETQAFMDGEKHVLIFSDAGGTGRSYHADLCCKNTKRRIQYLLESGWRADNAVQGLGRSHRTNQATAPIFRPVVTDIKGERRFISTISRRLDALGALTRGSRQTGGQGLFDPKDNLESTYAEAALRQFFSMLYNGQVKVCSLARFETATGLSLTTHEGMMKENLPGIGQFLNRILALPIQLQNDLFEVFEVLLEAKVEAAMAAGTYEAGVETLRAERFTVKSRETVYTHPTGGETVCIEIEQLERNPIATSNAALALSRDREGMLLVNDRSRRAAVKIPTTSTVNPQGAIVPRIALVRPSGRVKVMVSEFEKTTWRAANRREWQQLWDAEAANAPEFTTRRFFLISGLLLPIWNSLDSDNLRVFRLQTDTGERLLGRIIEPDAMPAIARALGLQQVKLTPVEIFDRVMEKRQRYQLPGGLSFKASMVMGEVRLEVVGIHISNGLCDRLKAVGCFTEVIQYRRRVFVPANAQQGVEVIEKVLELLH